MIVLKRIVDDGKDADHRADLKRVEITRAVVDEHRQLRFTQQPAVGFIIPRVARQDDKIPVGHTFFYKVPDYIDDMLYLRITAIFSLVFDDMALRGERCLVKIVPLYKPVRVIIRNLTDFRVHDLFEYRVRKAEHFPA